MKSVLISIRPKLVEKICHKIGEDETGKAIYEKRIEVRKSAPKEVPFKAYIYMTATKERCRFWEYITAYQNSMGDIVDGSQKVIGEFICDKIDEYPYDYCDGVDIDDDTILETAIDREDINIYAKGKTLYGWHISDLKIYDRPKELSAFYTKKKCNSCKKSGYESTACMYDEDCKVPMSITRAPQSWQYVEDLGEEE